MAELAAGDAGAEPEPAHADPIHGCVAPLAQQVVEIVLALGHGTHEDGAALLAAESPHVLGRTHDGSVGAERHLAAAGGQVAGDGAGDDLEQLLRGRGGADGQAVQQLHHEAREALEGAGQPDRGRDGDERVVRRRDVDLQEAGLVEGRVEEGEEALWFEVACLVSLDLGVITRLG